MSAIDIRDWPPPVPVRHALAHRVETPKPNGWWFCDPPTREEIRFRLDRTTGNIVAAFLRCSHGVWSDLPSARAAHSIEADDDGD